MDKVINIQKRIESQKQKRQLKRYRQRIEAIRKIAQCSSCHFRCAMCGQYLNMADSESSPDLSGHEYVFCDNCGEEFEDFLASSRGDKTRQVFWHNKEWKNMWSAWLRYQQTITGFLNSSECRLLQEEFDTQP